MPGVRALVQGCTWPTDAPDPSARLDGLPFQGGGSGGGGGGLEVSTAVALEILNQIPWGVKASLGYANPCAFVNGVLFEARILPFLSSGKRGSKPRVMRVMITHNAADYYDVKVTYIAKQAVRVHYAAQDIDASTLPNLLLALDYDGEQTLNPRML